MSQLFTRATSWCVAPLVVACAIACSDDEQASDDSAGSGGAGDGGAAPATGGSGTGGDAGSAGSAAASGSGGGSAGGSGGSAGGGAAAGSAGTGGSAGSGATAGTGGSAGTGATCDHDGSEATVTVSSTAELNDAIANASSGAVIWLQAADYACVVIENGTFTRDAPLILRKDPNETGAVTFVDGGCYFNTRITASSYVVLDGFAVDGGGATVWVEQSDHVIIRNLTITNAGQEGIRLRQSSSYVDIIDNVISNTGQTNPQYGECMYVGTGGAEDFPDQTEYVWIENNEVYSCGNGEGINVKAEAFHVTVRGNDIHDIAPGTAGQFNQSALTVEGAGRAVNHRPSDARDVWLENNTVSSVTFGDFASGIMVAGTGVFVVGNTVGNYGEFGIYVNGFGDLGLPVYLSGNQVDTSGQADYSLASGVDIRQEDPGANPNAPQDWYCY